MISTKIATFLLAIMAPLVICFGAVYKVGDDSGWHPMFNYKKWASSKKFFVGDTIRFEYNAIFHNVKEVTEPNFQACNGTNPIATYYSGNDSFNLEHPGHRYFLCGFPYHCNHGQKVDIYVLDTPSPTPSPSPGSAPPNPQPWPPSPATQNPAHNNTANTTNSAASSTHISSVHQIATKFITMIVLAYFLWIIISGN